MKKLKKDSLSELVYEQIGNMIANRDLIPGEKINRKEIANILGVSQTPVNEAVNRYANEGMIEQRERQGFYLKQFTDEDMKNLFAVRAGLEGVAIRLCVENKECNCLDEIIRIFDGFELPLSEKEYKRYRNADRNFHVAILMSSDNPIIIDFIRNFDFILKCYQKGLIRPPEETLGEHRVIIEAIMTGDAALAQNLIMEHHLRTKDFITASHIQ